jgi:uracil-DNA glycosylase family 4
MDLVDVYDAYQGDQDFLHSKLSHRKAVFIPGRGSETPKVLVVGPAPSAVDLADKRCFSGLVGASLTSLMKLAGLSPYWTGKLTGIKVIAGCGEGVPPNAWLTHLVKYRRETGPTISDLVHSRDYLRQEWTALGWPKVIIGIGDVVWKWLGPPGICEKSSIHWSVGQEFLLRGGVSFWPQYHPNYGIAHEEMRDKMEESWERMGAALREDGRI